MRPREALSDREIARRAGVAEREVIELAASLAETEDVAVIATCREGRRGGGGRYVCRDPQAVRAYAEQLHARARAIHGRAKRYRDLASRMAAGGLIDGSQARLFSEAPSVVDWARA